MKKSAPLRVVIYIWPVEAVAASASSMLASIFFFTFYSGEFHFFREMHSHSSTFTPRNLSVKLSRFGWAPSPRNNIYIQLNSEYVFKGNTNAGLMTWHDFHICVDGLTQPMASRCPWCWNWVTCSIRPSSICFISYMWSVIIGGVSWALY